MKRGGKGGNKEKRKKLITPLEKKIKEKEKIEKKGELKSLLYDLEDKLYMLKKKGVSKKTIDKVKEKIKKLKKKL